MNTLSRHLFSRDFIPCLASSILLQACALVPVRPPSPPFVPSQIARSITCIQEQNLMVRSFFCSGRLKFKDQDSQTESNFLFVGTRNPLKIKIEITHPWGRPIIHILVQKETIQALSFPEKRWYFGNTTATAFSKFFPGHLQLEQIWSLLRAYPSLVKYSKAVSLQGNQITLLDEEEKPKQIIQFDPESNLPKRLLYVGQGIIASFSDYSNIDGIFYAKKVTTEAPSKGSKLGFEVKQMVFNQELPDEIFRMKQPSGFEPVPLS